MTEFQTLRGMVDLLPMQTQRWQIVENLARHHFHRAGLKEIRTPLLEITELFARGIGEATDVVGKEMYTFLDRGDRSCTLRPEGTASVVRSVVQHGLLNQGPQRLWYGGPMFRYERPQAGRQRQFHQMGVEFFGLPSIHADAELISIAWDLLQDLGLKDLKLELNSLGTFEDRQNYHARLNEWLECNFKLLDKDSQDRIHKNPLRILDTKNQSTQELLKDAPLLTDYLSDLSKERFLCLQEALHKLKIPFDLNHNLVRGLDYYCHTAFEITSSQLGAQATVCGGGRYDRLVKQLGGPDTPSIGWAIGMERLIILLEDSIHKEQFVDVYFINRGELPAIEALSLTRKLRAFNIIVELDHSQANFSKQFKRANRSNAKWAIIMGEDEIAKGEIRLKRLTSSINGDGFDEICFRNSEFNELVHTLKN
ncbi:histidine--tRNA ligase [Prochlorococcus marinus]|uniref:Histidine--tRNA ligase n=1 Tax=Prochlorococcus marinus (strain MIT 9211) TaxID=93059 RepID=SYH_PROM4|nr:histidine--tRNA ligase [Prochlorococcus marinus]A9B9Z7.1 RecName: Full=Histidine--tRNA ligase; AltName: Full=Histidyl-tRNA synthetase; Short=HisRS [Prochlorococcus marinus str. MIT 9211]ABX08659.1 Histidyl-tRNA synthetase [Prochlorococcus marinus str. MIT 9211]